MRKLFQSEWHGISFSNFTKLSTETMADEGFYNAFYSALFEKYSSYQELDSGWRHSKDELADWLVKTLPDSQSVLSIGCGLGYMEQYLWHEYGNRLDLHVQDYASEAHRWLRTILPASRIHSPDECGENQRYDLIYLSAVDYAFEDDELAHLLAAAVSWLRPNGKVVMISASFLDETRMETILSMCKETTKAILERLGLFKRGQFWGYLRSRQEYQAIMERAGFASIDDGFIETGIQRSYWIEGGSVTLASH